MMRTADRLSHIEQMLKELLGGKDEREGYIDIRRASSYLSLSPKTIRRLVSEGKIPGYKVEGKILIPLAELEAFVQKQPVEVIDIKKMAKEAHAKIRS